MEVGKRWMHELDFQKNELDSRKIRCKSGCAFELMHLVYELTGSMNESCSFARSNG